MFTAVNWPELLEADQVCLVLAPSVMRELEKFKDDSSQQARRDRVRDVLSRLKPLLRGSTTEKPAVVSHGVSMFDITREPSLAWQDFGLDPQIGDDRLLASILTFAPTPPGHVVLLTNDFLAERKATSHGILSWEPEGKIAPVEQTSPLEKENRQLRQRLQAADNRWPKVVLGFWEAGALAQIVTRPMVEPKPRNNIDGQIELHLTKLRAEFNHRIDSMDSRIADSRVKNYRHDYERYLQKLRAYFYKSRAHQHGHRFRFDFVFANDGSTSIVEVSIQLGFPPGSFIVAIDDEQDDHYGFGDLEEPSEPVAPFPPLPYHLSFDLGSTSALPLANLLSRPAREPEPRGPLYDELDRGYVAYETPKLRHKEKWIMEPIVAYVLVERPGGFSIGYTIRADNLPEPIEKQLNVVLETEQ